MGTFDGTDMSVKFPQTGQRKKPLDWIDDRFGDSPDQATQMNSATPAESERTQQAVPA